MSRLWEWVELVLAFGLAPVAVALFVPPAAWIPVLWLAAGAAALHLRWRGAHFPPDLPAPAAVSRRKLALRFLVSAVVVLAGTAALAPALFLSFPRERPLLWLAVMVLYPALSVYPQEFLYRSYFFRRFRGLARTEGWLAGASALAFCWVHVIFRNPYALGLTLVGGFFFADTYRRTRSLRVVAVEHAGYGCLVFTAGLGRFFY